MEEKIEKKLEKIRNNDTGFSVKIYAILIWVFACVYSVYGFYISIVTRTSTGNGVDLSTYVFLVLKYAFIIFISFVISDILKMFYEIHFIIKHRKN